MQCAGNANTNVSFHVNAGLEQILFPWHTWARSKGFENNRAWVVQLDLACRVAGGGGKFFRVVNRPKITGWEQERLSVSNAPVFVSEAPFFLEMPRFF